MIIVAFVVALSIIVAIHEYGHYIVGRWCGIKADVFSLGFGKVLFARTDRHGTQWQVAALPFGGFVKFRGDSDPASGKDGAAIEELSPEDRRATMHGAPLWARVATVSAGPVFNFILSILIFAGVGMYQGKPVEPLTVGEIKPLPYDGITLEPGDRIEAIAGVEMPDRGEEDAFEEFVDALPQERLLSYRVIRDGVPVEVEGPHPIPPLISQLAPKSAAYDIDMRAGDVILSVEGREIAAFEELREVVEGSDGRPIALEVWREGEILDFVLVPRSRDEQRDEGGFESKWRIGIAGGFAFEPATEPLGPVAAVGRGVELTGDVIATSLSGLWHMVTGAISSCNMSGPIGIAQVSGAMASQGPDNFIWFIAVLSTAVGLLNLFPIPVLDGGHLMFYAYEAVRGKPPSDAALRVMMAVGLSLILGLMLFALLNDILC
ncbi:RIP metalloprotease RseP [Roseovarius sp. SCSIO 43702]|nr:RIP metalloprotease RseP [Roseovarius sp. SCSIO 43702]QYX58575.1 RIP metalloprotease RseP [Roseovarius sp. SCSIO 43702]